MDLDKLRYFAVVPYSNKQVIITHHMDVLTITTPVKTDTESREGGLVLPIFVHGGVRMEGQIPTQKHGFPEKFASKNIGILHISHPKIWVKIVF